MHSKPVRWALLVLLGAVSAAPADEREQETESGPSMEMLEFLGEWETDRGQWFDPLWLADVAQTEPEPERTQTTEGEGDD